MRSSDKPSSSPVRDRGIIESSPCDHKVCCPRNAPQIHPHRRRGISTELSTLTCSSLVAESAEASTFLHIAHAGAIESRITELRAYSVERGVQPRCANVIEEAELPSGLETAHRDADEAHGARASVRAILCERGAEELAADLVDREVVVGAARHGALPRARVERLNPQLQRDRATAQLR